MPTDRHLDNVVALAGAVLEAYRPGELLYEALRSVPGEEAQSTALEITVRGEGRDFASLVAAVQAVQLAVDTAAVVVLYELEFHSSAGVAPDGKLLRGLASNPVWSIEIEELGGNSFRAKLKAVFSSTIAQVVGAVAGIVGVVLAACFPHVVVVGLVVPLGLAVAAGVVAIVTALVAAETQKGMQQAIEGLEQRANEADRRSAQAEAKLRRLQLEVQSLVDPSVLAAAGATAEIDLAA